MASSSHCVRFSILRALAKWVARCALHNSAEHWAKEGIFNEQSGVNSEASNAWLVEVVERLLRLSQIKSLLLFKNARTFDRNASDSTTQSSFWLHSCYSLFTNWTKFTQLILQSIHASSSLLTTTQRPVEQIAFLADWIRASSASEMTLLFYSEHRIRDFHSRTSRVLLFRSTNAMHQYTWIFSMYGSLDYILVLSALGACYFIFGTLLSLSLCVSNNPSSLETRITGLASRYIWLLSLELLHCVIVSVIRRNWTQLFSNHSCLKQSRHL